MDCTDQEACILANIAPSSLYNYQSDYPEFLERKKLLRHTPILKARQTIIGALDTPVYALKYLERKRPEEFGDYVRPKAEEIVALTKEQIEKLDRIARGTLSESVNTEISRGNE